MAHYKNAAWRVYNLIESVAHTGDDRPAHRVWATAFGLDHEVSSKDPFEVQSRLSLLRSEIENIESQMDALGYSEELYVPYLGRVRKTVTISNLDAQWQSYKQYLKSDTLLAIRYCAELTPNEAEVSMEELQEVLQKVVEFRAEIESMGISHSMRQFLLNQLDIIERGVQNYPIQGGTAIREAVMDGFSAAASKVPTPQNEDELQEAGKIGGIWGEFKKAGSEVIEAEKIVSSYANLLATASAVGTVGSQIVALLQGAAT